VSAFASGVSPCDDRNCTSFFSPEIIHSRPRSQSFGRAQRLSPGRCSIGIPDINAEEGEVLPRKVDLSKISYLVYSMTADDLRPLISAIEGQKVTLRGLDEELKADLAKSSSRTNQLSALRYLLLAKQVEPWRRRTIGIRGPILRSPNLW
jgi:hypothetical protein